MISECKKLLDNLSILEKTNTVSLPVDTATIRLLKGYIKSHKKLMPEIGLLSRTDFDFNEAINSLDNIKLVINQIKKDITRENQPINLIESESNPEVVIMQEEATKDASITTVEDNNEIEFETYKINSISTSGINTTQVDAAKGTDTPPQFTPTVTENLSVKFGGTLFGQTQNIVNETTSLLNGNNSKPNQ